MYNKQCEASMRWREKNLEEYKAYQKKYHKEHAEQLRAAKKAASQRYYEKLKESNNAENV